MICLQRINTSRKLFTPFPQSRPFCFVHRLLRRSTRLHILNVFTTDNYGICGRRIGNTLCSMIQCFGEREPRKELKMLFLLASEMKYPFHKEADEESRLTIQIGGWNETGTNTIDSNIGTLESTSKFVSEPNIR